MTLPKRLHLIAFATVVFILNACLGLAVVLEQVNTTSTQTLTNKTLTAPVIGTIVNTGTLTLPTSTDTLVGRSTTDTLSNKVLSSPQITNPQYSGTTSGVHTYNLSTLAGSALGTYTFAGTPTITAPAISNPTLSGGGVFGGTYTGTYTLAGTPTISSPTLTTPTVSSGIFTLTSGQMAFPATQAGSAGANTLDDYEENTWTPAVGGSATYTAQTGHYTKIGRQVTVTCSLVINAIGTGSTTVISGLPFTNAGVASTGAGYYASSVTSITSLVPTVAASGTQVTLYSIGAAGASLATNAIFQNGTTVAFTLTYFAAT